MAEHSSDDEAAWRDLVAHITSPVATDGGPAPWPPQEDLPEHPAQDAAPPAGAATPGTAGPAPPTPGSPQAEAADAHVPGLPPASPQFRVIRPAGQPPDGRDTGALWDDTDADDHYVPPEPPPLPHLDAVSKGAWAAVFGGPAYLLVAVMLGWAIASWAALAAVAAFIGGFATLVVRMGDHPPHDSDDDDGAVV